MKIINTENMTSMKKEFAAKVRDYLKRSHLPQTNLATLLNLTPSAICQMIDCYILFKPEQLSIIAKAMKLTEDEYYDLKSLLFKMRNGSALSSPFNKLMLQLRKNKGCTIAELAKMTKIKRVKLKSMEEDYDAILDFDELVSLSTVYDYKLHELIKKAENSHHTILGIDDDDDDFQDSTLNDSYSTPFIKDDLIPMFDIEDFTNHNDNINFDAIVMSSTAETYTYSSDRKVIALKATNELLDNPCPGETVLIVRPKQEDDENAKLFVGMTKKRSFYIFYFDRFGNFTPLYGKPTNYKTPTLKWQFTVDEIIIKPEGIK